MIVILTFIMFKLKEELPMSVKTKITSCLYFLIILLSTFLISNYRPLRTEFCQINIVVLRSLKIIIRRAAIILFIY